MYRYYLSTYPEGKVLSNGNIWTPSELANIIEPYDKYLAKSIYDKITLGNFKYTYNGFRIEVIA